MDNNVIKKRPPPISFRLDDEADREELKRRAAISNLSVGGYIKSEIFDRPPPRRSRIPHVNIVELARLQGLLGRVSNNLNQIAKMGHVQGEFSIPELTIALNELIDMREAIMNALGYQNPSGNDQGDRSS